METLLVGIVPLVLLLAILAWALYVSRETRRRGNYYLASLLDLKNGSKVIDSFMLYDFSDGQARAHAYGCLKKRPLYQADDDLREFIRIYEIGDEFSSAGYEFDVLPEALRRFVLNISIADKKKTVGGGRGSSGCGCVHGGCGCGEGCACVVGCGCGMGGS